MKYEKCLTCVDLGSACDGPNFIAMDTAEMGQWCNQKRKQIAGMTYDKIAAETGISKSAVHGFLTGAHADYRIETIRPIIKLITGGKWDDNPCGNLSNSEKAKYEESVRHLKSEIKWKDDKIQHLISENDTLHTHADNMNKIVNDRYEFLKRKDRIMWVLGIMLFVTVATIITALAIDAMNPNIGFFWLQ